MTATWSTCSKPNAPRSLVPSRRRYINSSLPMRKYRLCQNKDCNHVPKAQWAKEAGRLPPFLLRSQPTFAFSDAACSGLSNACCSSILSPVSNSRVPVAPSNSVTAAVSVSPGREGSALKPSEPKLFPTEKEGPALSVKAPRLRASPTSGVSSSESDRDLSSPLESDDSSDKSGLLAAELKQSRPPSATKVAASASGAIRRSRLTSAAVYCGRGQSCTAAVHAAAAAGGAGCALAQSPGRSGADGPLVEP
mmetsp:Transcript_38260/g.110394  ORF Transcript_38260/g.110394 Transcript_38260/m.110394 type:complete len:250 (+) Transcript_38260:1513-2262(+)